MSQENVSLLLGQGTQTPDMGTSSDTHIFRIFLNIFIYSNASVGQK